MKLSISLPGSDVAYIDELAKTAGSRSAAVQAAIRQMREHELEAQYEEAYAEWEGSEDQRLWDLTSSDGIE